MYFQWICESVCTSRNLISLCFLDEEAVDLLERVVKTDQTVQTYRLIWIFTKHTEFVEITVFQKIQFAQLQKVNIHILGYNHFFLFFLNFLSDLLYSSPSVELGSSFWSVLIYFKNK